MHEDLGEEMLPPYSLSPKTGRGGGGGVLRFQWVVFRLDIYDKFT